MQPCGIVTRVLLVLYVVDFAFGAPAAVRESLLMPVNVGVLVAEDGAATPQKRYNPLDDWSITNTAVQWAARQHNNRGQGRTGTYILLRWPISR